MKKTLIILLAVVAICFAVMPYVTGKVAEQATHQLAAQLNSNSQQYGEVKIDSYERGFSSTKTNLSWSPTGLASGMLAEPVQLQCEGEHGVLKYTYDCTALNLEGYSDFIDEQLGGTDPISVGGEVSVFGKVTQNVKLTAFELQQESGDQLEVMGGLIEITTDQAMTQFDVSGSLGGFSATGEDGFLRVGDIRLGGDMVVNEHQLTIGEFSADVSQLEIKSKTDGDLVLKDLSMLSETTEQNQNMKVAYQLKANQYRQNNNAEPGNTNPESVSLDDIQFDISIAGINMQQFAIMTEKVRSVSKLPEEERSAAWLGMLPDLESLLKSGLVLDTSLGADYQSEAVAADATVELVGDLSFGNFVLIAVNPQSFFSKFAVDVKARFPEAVLAANPQAISVIENSPWYTKSGSGYESNFQLKENLVELNGRKVPLEELVSLLTQ